MRTLAISVYISAAIVIAANVVLPTNSISKFGAILSLIGIASAACISTLLINN